MHLRHVRQRNKSSGCGPACVAILAGVGFDQAVRAIWGRDQKTGLYTDYGQLRLALKKLGVRAARGLRSASFASAPGVYIYGCQRNKTKDYWHWVVYDGRTQRLYDPLKPRFSLANAEALDREYRPYSRMRVWPRRSSA